MSAASNIATMPRFNLSQQHTQEPADNGFYDNNSLRGKRS